MNTTFAVSASARLQRLAGFLAQDPDNVALLADACDSAMACGRHDEADTFIATAERVAPGASDWQLRRAQLCIARRDLPRARALLEQLEEGSGHHPVVVHDLAYVHLLSGDAAMARSVLQPWAEERFAGPAWPHDSTQALWLRACHHAGHLEEAWGWVQRAQAAGDLQPAAAGVASLVALDLDNADAARDLAGQALAADGAQAEALLTRGCLALADGDGEEAIALLQRAAHRLPGDARVACGLGFAHLLGGNATAALQPLEGAVEAMPDHPDAWQALGWARLLVRDATGAVAAFRAARDLDSDDAESHASLGLVLLLAGDRDAARVSLQRAEELDANDVVAALARALMIGEAGRADVERLLRGLLAQWRPRP